MSYILADSTGVLDDFASIGGLADFNDWARTQPAVIRAFVARGFTEDLGELKAALTKVTVPAKVKAQVEVLRMHVDDAKDVLIISDGMSDEEDDFRAAKREPKPKIEFAFNRKTQSAIDWADQHAAELIDGISETSREAINNAVAEYLETGDWAEYKDEILAAVGDSERANLIARNESMVAVHEGQREAWNQAIEEGLLPEIAVREWIVVGDEKVCSICFGLEGKTAQLGEAYIDDDGEEYEGPPAHVSCRCSEGIVST